MHGARDAHHGAQGARGFRGAHWARGVPAGERGDHDERGVPSRGAHGASGAHEPWGAHWMLGAPERGAAGGARRASLCVVAGPPPCQLLCEGHWCA